MKVYQYDSNGFFSHVHQCQPDPMNAGEFLKPNNVTDIEPTFKEGKLTRFVDGEWTLEVDPQIAIDEAARLKRIEDEAKAEKDSRIPNLWSSANNYQSDKISGAAIGLVTMGVLANKPKSLAVQGWITSIWMDYYTRKATCDQATPSYDFSNNGDIPFTVPELMQEVMG